MADQEAKASVQMSAAHAIGLGADIGRLVRGDRSFELRLLRIVQHRQSLRAINSARTKSPSRRAKRNSRNGREALSVMGWESGVGAMTAGSRSFSLAHLTLIDVAPQVNVFVSARRDVEANDLN